MSYIGLEPRFTHFPSQFFSGDGTAMSLALTYPVANDAAILVFIDGIKQDTSAYNINEFGQLVFTGNVPAGTDNVQVVYMGLVLDSNEIGNDTITVNKFNTTGTASTATWLRGDFAWSADVYPTGSSGDAIFYNNEKEINNNYTIPSSQNSYTVGPINIASGVTVTVPSGSNWTII